MTDHFPEYVDPFALALSGRTIEQTLPLDNFERVTELLLDKSGSVDIKVVFGVDEAAVIYLEGVVSADVQLPCQRCMEPMSTPISSSFVMGLVRNEDDFSSLPESYEPLLVDDKNFSLLAFIEDELILAVPVVVTHPIDECSASRYLQDSNVIEEEKKRNPFQILEQLKR
ncbi:MAG: DUF177 domain-containing protein [Gammaproteobacteria bacterium]|uniref:Large ribosomal RNA subunit accumulation protein YceD n=1 Tax=Candidatus Thiopontia autotrophica TaxID=2841688 RepID=A0A8J6P9H4_9GAMM|nr:DUF177 domain-containing protein [Candidatus Thiopontia autotrophica]MBL6969541.1 DUF177 domain-containing protein [Gammaproteobacteria bacterium]